MKVGTRLTKSLESLANDVLAESDSPSVVANRLRSWYQRFLCGIIHHSRGDTSVVNWFLATNATDLPVTSRAIAITRQSIRQYETGSQQWSIEAAVGALRDVVVHRDWDDCCDSDQGDLEFCTDDAGHIAKVCDICGNSQMVHGTTFAAVHSRPSSLGELVAVGILPRDA